jgi:two-component system sensor histidine kinase/response regulator
MHPDPQTSASANLQAIDPQVIQGLRDLGGEDEPELLEELIDIFLEDAPHRMKDISEGFVAGDLGRVERGAHTLKSSSANIGALGLSEICRQIVERARTQRTQDLAQLCDASARSLAQAESELRSLKT